jgi:uncharacterized membrane protein
MEGPEVEHAHHHHTGRSWLDLILGVSAVSISFISLFLAIHNGNAMERLVQRIHGLPCKLLLRR